MPAYIIVYRETPVTDPAAIAEYSRLNREHAEDYQKRYGILPRVVYGDTVALEGPAPDGVVMLEFPTMEAAKSWYESDSYQAAVAIRQKAAQWRAVLVDGLG